MTLDQDTIDQGFDLQNGTASHTDTKLLIAKGIRLQKDRRGSIGKDRLNDGQRRLAKIVKEGFDASDTLIRDDPNPPLGLRRREYVYSSNPYLMSGALVTGGKKALDGFLTTGIAEDPGDTVIRYDCIKPSPPEPIFAPFLNDMATVTESTVSGVNSGNTTPNQASPCGHTRIADSKESKQNGNCNLFQYGSPQTHGTPTRRQTPVPPPEPWRGLGLANPFSENPLPTFPNNGRQPSQSRTLSTSLTVGSSPDTYLRKLRGGEPEFLLARFEPMSSPLLRRSLRLKAQKRKQRK